MLELIKTKMNDNHKIIADIGCGDLYFTNILSRELNRTVYAIDTAFTDLRSHNDGIVKLNGLEQMDDGSIDIAVLMDVLEHVENPVEFLQLLRRKCAAGFSVFTVPTYQHLFSEHDVFLKHYRRYNKWQLYNELDACGFKVERIFYFYSTLYLPRLVQTLVSRWRKTKDIAHPISAWGYDENTWLTKFVRSVFNLDFKLNKSLPSLFGLSVCAVCTIN